MEQNAKRMTKITAGQKVKSVPSKTGHQPVTPAPENVLPPAATQTIISLQMVQNAKPIQNRNVAHPEPIA
jgi:hypothetical protein